MLGRTALLAIALLPACSGQTSEAAAGDQAAVIAAAETRPRVYAYLPSDEVKVADVPWDVVTDLMLFSAELRADGTVAAWHRWSDGELVAEAHRHRARAHLSVSMIGADAALGAFLGAEGAQRAAIDALVGAVARHGGDGIDLDFEFVPKASRERFSVFVEELAHALKARLHDAELTLAMPSNAQYPGYDVARLGAAADRLLLMEYDIHDDSGEQTGPVAPLTAGGVWDETVEADVLGYLAKVDRARLAMGVPFYGLDWPAASRSPGARTQGEAEYVDYADAVVAAAKLGRRWDAASQTPWYTYASEGTTHQVWYDDAESLRRKLRFADAHRLGGTMVWALGMDHGRQDLWNVFRERR